MDERVSQFYLSVGRLCGDARIGGLTVRLKLASGGVVIGVPEALPETQGAEELDTIGYADAVTVETVVVPLSNVVAATVMHPGVPANDA